MRHWSARPEVGCEDGTGVAPVAVHPLSSGDSQQEQHARTHPKSWDSAGMAIAPIEPSVLRVDDDGITLLGGWSATSGFRHFPRSAACPFTGADDVVPVDLPRSGTVWLHTTVHLAAAGLRGPTPYGLGIVELDGEPLLRIVTRLDGRGPRPRHPGPPPRGGASRPRRRCRF